MPIAFTPQTKLCQPDAFPKQNWFCSGRYRLILLWQRPFPRGWITQPRNQILTHWVATTEWAELEPRPNGLSWYNCESILTMAMCIRTLIMTMWTHRLWQCGYRHRLWEYGHMAKLVHWQLWNLDHEKRHTKWIDKLVISLLWQYSYSVHQFALIPFSTCGPRVPEHDPMGLRIESSRDEPNPKFCLMSQKHICTLWMLFKRNKRI